MGVAQQLHRQYAAGMTLTHNAVHHGCVCVPVTGFGCTHLQVLSPATIVAIDLAALTLLDLPCLVAFVLGVLADEFGWIAKSFPQAFSVSGRPGVAAATMSLCTLFAVQVFDGSTQGHMRHRQILL